ncbi:MULTISPECIES: tRNA 5-methoxyuridine(34)/uridine 5-oxyacetic acid(34) synthase CmoB [unclassified Campylobacter]|uniref:tRNA 5-methoxyuridine(34)/uridine 5-oxyacetic acid(34) synthase CmoB n=1 Tax=unclassified Campylobacter TaxID=2593542 RepID=UPI001D82ACF5|nr:tRNA 5-methoxyuridine(34)/uridine 5-oxyacetic acid(34) synthase CmoB [Campylobacter sp. RM9331]MBZ8005290.1 tRNA 5-methoxyuridine(34)/uridine 5-oxyacetic acid(34) synthase CmoB [Campylobacter sp. RM9332]
MKVIFDDIVEIYDNTLNEEDLLIKAKSLKPWRKGPFKINNIFIDSEWKSNIKYNILKKHIGCIENKIVADVGCNNGYYMFRMQEFRPTKIVGFDPSQRYYEQFTFLNSLFKTNIVFERLGVADLPSYNHKFDVIFCLGVIYHRSDPVQMLKQLKQSLNTNGIVFLDTIYFDSEQPFALVPDTSYAKMSNVYFIPSIKALQNWCKKANFKEFEILATSKTTIEEQRKTDWIDGYSLEDFLEDDDFTKEGYPAPKRIYIKLKV